MVQLTICYNVCFFTYAWLFPVFLRYLFTAQTYEPPGPFLPVPLKTLEGKVPELYMSSFPQTTADGVNHCRPCMEMGGQRSGMYQWDITLSISYKDLIEENKDKPVSTMYPLVFASNDAKEWKVVADADDVAGKWHASPKSGPGEATHLSAPLLVANLKNFGCVDDDTSDTDSFFHHFPSKRVAHHYKWKLIDHVALHGSVNLVACVMQGMDDMNQIIHTYARDCLFQGEMKCHLPAKEALSKCFAIGSACGNACGIFSPKSPECVDGTVDPRLFEGLTKRRVKVKTSPGGGGAAEALSSCSQKPCKEGYHFNNMYVEAENPIEFLEAQMDVKNKEKGSYYVLMYALSDFHPPTHTFNVEVADDDSDEDDEDTDETDQDKSKSKGKDKDTGDEDEEDLKDKDTDSKDKDMDSKDVKDVKDVKDAKDAKDEESKKDESKNTGDKKTDSKSDAKTEHRAPTKSDTKDDDKNVTKPADQENTTAVKAPETAPKPKPKPKKPKKKVHQRTCVDLPGVRLGDIDGSSIDSLIADERTSDPLGCTAECGKRIVCKQSVFAQKNKGCYLFKLATVEVREYDPAFNSSYCGDSKDKDDMMTMLHQAYKAYVPPSPSPMGGGAPVRVLSEASRANAGKADANTDKNDGGPISSDKKYYWQIAHVPNLTMGVLTDQGANEVRVIPRNTSCFTTPGFTFMVACMTAKPVYISDRTHFLAPPPFNDRCLAVGGKCGATCGSAQVVEDNVASHCSRGKPKIRQLQDVPSESEVPVESSPYESLTIAEDKLVKRITPKKPSNSPAVASRLLFNVFVIICIISYISTILSKFPGNFRDNYPIHTWDEIRTHGYVLEKFGSAVTCSTSTGDNKMIVFRNWLGKVTTRPQFDDTAFPTFSKWVDVFCDEEHREGARLLWMAWTDFLDTNPPMEFLQEWAVQLRKLTWKQTSERSPFDLKWGEGKGKKILPLVPEQAEKLFGSSGDCPDGGIILQPDTLAKLKDLCEVYKLLPLDLRMEFSLPRSDDVVLTRRVMLGLQEGNKSNSCFTLPYSKDWRAELHKKVDGRMVQQGLEVSKKEEYQKSLVVTNPSGKRISIAEKAHINEQEFPLHVREPPARKDKQVIMIYCARAKPEVERKGIELTRGLDMYLWATLQPKMVRKGTNSGQRRSFRRTKAEESMPLLNDDLSERSWSSVSGGGNGNCPVFPEAKRCVEGVVARQHEEFLKGLEGATEDSKGGAMLVELTQAYLRYRTVDSDWEMARFCYGEVVGLERDVDGNEVVILDNPSPALLELVSDLPSLGSFANPSGRPSMGLVAIEEVRQTQGFLGNESVTKTIHAMKPSLEFLFNGEKGKAKPSGEFQKEFRKVLQQGLALSAQDISALVIKEKQQGSAFVMELTGPGKLIESIRAGNFRNMQVLDYYGRMTDGHPHVMVRKDLLMPYAGVRGRSGGLNFVVDLLQFREGFIGTGETGDPTAERMLLGVFDSRHQPHNDFWRKCLPKFVDNTDAGYTYKVNEDIALVQAPESFGDGHEDELLTGVSSSILNLIRNRCGGVTSCGTNAVWQVSAREFSRQEDNAVTNEFFQSRTLLDPTATSHRRFSQGKRSVYVHETVSTGIPEEASEHLCSLQMRVEGAVQLFWVEFFGDRRGALVLLAVCIILLAMALLYSLNAPWFQNTLGYNVFCSAPGQPTISGGDMFLCDWAKTLMSLRMDTITWTNTQYGYIMLFDAALIWLMVCVIMVIPAIALSWTGFMPMIVRVFITMEDISYWMTSCNIFYWLVLAVLMVIGTDPPLMFDPVTFMAFTLTLNLAQHLMLNTYKGMLEVSENAIWRSQQSHTFTAPLHMAAIYEGTRAALKILWRGQDCSFWRPPSDHTENTIRGLTVWVTGIWLAFALVLAATFFIEFWRWSQWLLGGMQQDPLEHERFYSALLLLGLISVTVWDSFLAFWEADMTVESLSNNEKRSALVRQGAKLVIWWRKKTWMLRYAIDFVCPIYVFCGGPGSLSLVTVVAYAMTVHGLRI